MHYGWKQIGPAYFYLLAPWYWVTGESPFGLVMGALAINLVAAVGVVVVVRRELGEVAASWAALAVLVYAAILRGFLRDWWNPELLPMPTLLFLVLATFALTQRSVGYALLAVLVGSALAQTHLGVGLLVVACLAAVATWLARNRVRVRSPSPLATALGLVLLGALWALPIYEQLTREPGNLGKIVSYLRHGEGAQTGWTRAIRSVATQLATVPSGHAATFFDPELAGFWGLVLAGAMLGVALGVIFLARDEPPVAALAAIGVAGALVAVLSARQARDYLSAYRMGWAGALSAAIVLAAVLLVGPRLPKPASWVVVAPAVLVAVQMLTVAPQPASWLVRDRVHKIATLAAEAVDGEEPSTVLLRFSYKRGYGYAPAATIATELKRAGWTVRFPERAATYVADGRLETGDEDAVLVLTYYGRGIDDADVVGSVGIDVLWRKR